MRKRSRLFVAAVLAAVLAVPAVSVSAGSVSDLPNAHGANGENFKVAYVPTTSGAPNTLAWLRGIKQILDQDPKLTVAVFDGDMKAETQVAIIQDLISQQFDAIILQPVDEAALTAVVIEAEEEGIPVVTLNNRVKGKFSCVVQVADVESGYAIGKAMGEQLGGKGNVAIIQSPPGAATGVNREMGFRKAIEDLYPDIKIVGAQNGEWKKDKAISVMNSLMQANQQLDGVFAVNDIMALGAVVAAEAANRLDKIRVWGMNGQSDALLSIEQGKLSGTAFTDHLMQGNQAANIVIHLLTSGEGPAKGARPGVLKVPPFIADKDTVKDIPQSIRW